MLLCLPLASMTTPPPEHRLPAVEDDDITDHEMTTERVQRAQWLRAAILGATDGLISTASLMLGMDSIRGDRRSMVLSGFAGALAGACSMAVGEFVSVATQRAIEESTVSRCSTGSGKTKSCKQNDDHAVASPPPPIINSVSVETMPAQMNTAPTDNFKLPFGPSPARSPMMKVIMANTEKKETLPNPYKAAAASALAFLCGSFVPLASAMFVTNNTVRTKGIALVASIGLAVFGGVGAQLGGASIWVSAARVLVGGWIAMAITYGLLKPFERDEE